MCKSCEKMSRRTFTKTSLSAATFVVAGSVPESSFASFSDFSIPGELTPSYKKGPFNKGVNRDDLNAYRHSTNTIKSIAYHHEGWANENQRLYDEKRAQKSEQSVVQRVVHIMHDSHVKKGYGMLAYHYAISPSGQVVKGRPLQFAPATGSKDPKTGQIADFDGHLAVVLLADFDFERVLDREKQILAMAKVISAAQRRFRVPSKDIRPHKDHVAFEGKFGSKCPGKNLYAVREKIEAMILAVGLQSELAKLGYYSGRVDGKFGPISKRALTSYSVSANNNGSISFSDETLWSLLDNPT